MIKSEGNTAICNNLILEGSAKLSLKVPKIISKDMAVFYNPVMKLNRDLSIILLNSLDRENLRISLPLSGTGIRGVRFLLEIKKKIIKTINFNDYNFEFEKKLIKTFKLNKIKYSKTSRKIKLNQRDANTFLLDSQGFDYIDLDPFGSPNIFLDSAIKRISREGILVVTATDTSALSGSYENACKRKYWAKPLRNHLMHEFGIRILARKVQLIGAQYDKALIPIFSHSSNHYMRMYFHCKKGKKIVDEILKQHKIKFDSGPIWTGQLWNNSLVKKMQKFAEKTFEKDLTLQKLLSVLAQESQLEFPFFHNIHRACKKSKFVIPKFEVIKKEIKKAGYSCSPTHFTEYGIKSDIPGQKLIQILKKLQKK